MLTRCLRFLAIRRHPAEQPHQHLIEAERDRLIAITSGQSRSPGSGVDSDPSPGLDTGAAFSPVAPALIITSKRN